MNQGMNFIILAWELSTDGWGVRRIEMMVVAPMRIGMMLIGNEPTTGRVIRATVSGPESQDRYEELKQQVDAHCPVLDLFGNATPVTTELVA